MVVPIVLGWWLIGGFFTGVATVATIEHITAKKEKIEREYRKQQNAKREIEIALLKANLEKEKLEKELALKNLELELIRLKAELQDLISQVNDPALKAILKNQIQSLIA